MIIYKYMHYLYIVDVTGLLYFTISCNTFAYSCYRYAFIRYNSVDEAISAYKQAHDLMWDTRSIIVRFRRQRGNACLPGEPKSNVKKVKEESNNAGQVKKEQNANHVEFKPNVKKLKEEGNNANQMKKDNKINHADKLSTNQDANSVETRLQDNSNKAQNKPNLQTQEQNVNSHSPMLPTLITSTKTAQEQQQQPWVINIKLTLLNCDILQ